MKTLSPSLFLLPVIGLLLAAYLFRGGLVLIENSPAVQYTDNGYSPFGHHFKQKAEMPTNI